MTENKEIPEQYAQLLKNEYFVTALYITHGYELISPATFEILKRMGAEYL